MLAFYFENLSIFGASQRRWLNVLRVILYQDPKLSYAFY